MPDFNLCVVTDGQIAGGRDLLKIVCESLVGGAGVIQLREKGASAREFLSLALRIKKLFRDYGERLFIVNDRVDIALASGADGVHLGREDMPVSYARRILGSESIIGVSVSSADEARRAVSEGASYLGAGAVYHSATKPEAGVIGLSGIREISSAVAIPVVGIGGLNSGNVREIIKAGASGAAVVSEVMAADNPRFAVENLLKEIVRKC